MSDNTAEVLPQIHIPGVSDNTQGVRTNVHHVFILDASGSMRSLRRQTITGFNEQVQNIRQLEQQFPSQRNLVTLVVFNGRTEVRFFDSESDSLQEITEAAYDPSGSTRLYGSVGETVSRLKASLGDRCSQERVLITIMTDGENTDHDATWGQTATAEYLQQVQKDHNWVVTFIGANIDVASAAKSLNIPVSNTVAYTASEVGTRRAFAAAARGRTSYLMRSHGAGGQSMSNEAFYSADLARGLDLRDGAPVIDTQEVTAANTSAVPLSIDDLSRLYAAATPERRRGPAVPAAP